MTTYDEEMMNSVASAVKALDHPNLDDLDKISDPRQMAITIQWLIQNLQYTTRMLYIIIKNEMTETNRIHELIGKLPKTDDFDEIRTELERQRKDSAETLLPIKQLSEALTESKNKKLSYIG